METFSKRSLCVVLQYCPDEMDILVSVVRKRLWAPFISDMLSDVCAVLQNTAGWSVGRQIGSPHTCAVGHHPNCGEWQWFPSRDCEIRNLD